LWRPRAIQAGDLPTADDGEGITLDLPEADDVAIRATARLRGTRRTSRRAAPTSIKVGRSEPNESLRPRLLERESQRLSVNSGRLPPTATKRVPATGVSSPPALGADARRWRLGKEMTMGGCVRFLTGLALLGVPASPARATSTSRSRRSHVRRAVLGNPAERRARS